MRFDCYIWLVIVGTGRLLACGCQLLLQRQRWKQLLHQWRHQQSFLLQLWRQRLQASPSIFTATRTAIATFTTKRPGIDSTIVAQPSFKLGKSVVTVGAFVPSFVSIIWIELAVAVWIAFVIVTDIAIVALLKRFQGSNWKVRLQLQPLLEAEWRRMLALVHHRKTIQRYWMWTMDFHCCLCCLPLLGFYLFFDSFFKFKLQ